MQAVHSPAEIKMSLVRAFTTRRANRPEKLSLVTLGRSGTQRSLAMKIERSQISAPVALLSSTNVLSYEAPDIAGTTPIAHRDISAGSSLKSSRASSGAEDSDASSTDMHSSDSLTDASSVDENSAPPTPTSPEPNHLSCYFKPSVSTESVPRRSSSVRSSSVKSIEAPIIPQRAASHSKKAHVQLSRKRSVQRMATPSRDFARYSADTIASDVSVEPPTAHPFVNELSQLDEAVEELGSVVRDAAAEADLAYMNAHGLAQFCASDYLSELSGMHNNVFEEDATLFARAGWI